MAEISFSLALPHKIPRFPQVACNYILKTVVYGTIFSNGILGLVQTMALWLKGMMTELVLKKSFDCKPGIILLNLCMCLFYPMSTFQIN